MTTIPQGPTMPRLDVDTLVSDGALIRRGNEYKPTLGHPALSRSQRKNRMR
jgi:hypothetical protein